MYLYAYVGEEVMRKRGETEENTDRKSVKNH